MSTSIRSETLYVSRSVYSRLQAYCLLQTGDVGLVPPDQFADTILREFLDNVPQLKERQEKIRKALQEIDAEFRKQSPPSPSV